MLQDGYYLVMSLESLAALKAILVQHGNHLTKARETTFKLLVSAEPQSMREIMQKAEGKVDRVSVYRNVALFEKLGIVRRIYVGWKYKLELSDQFMEHHHHLSCLSCGKIIDIEDEKHINEFINQVSEKFNFSPRHHQFEIDGYCKDCST